MARWNPKCDLRTNPESSRIEFCLLRQDANIVAQEEFRAVRADGRIPAIKLDAQSESARDGLY